MRNVYEDANSRLGDAVEYQGSNGIFITKVNDLDISVQEKEDPYL
jgi:hypothetical protein